jgi:hypothetical protein
MREHKGMYGVAKARTGDPYEINEKLESEGWEPSRYDI